MNYGNIARNWKVQLVALAVILAVAGVALQGLNFGIEFKGGVRIPISVISERGLTADEMSDVVDTLKLRINKYGLAQSIVRPLGDREIIVEVPLADERVIKSVEEVLKQQGHFEATIDGKSALTGADILQNSVGGPNGEQVTQTGEGTQWEISFAVRKDAGERFAQAALGKTEYPVYMFLDRPSNAVVLMSKQQLLNVSTGLAGEDLLLEGMEEALQKEGDDLLLLIVGNSTAQEIAGEILESGKSKVIVGEGLASGLISKLERAGFSLPESANASNGSKTVVVVPDEEMLPSVSTDPLKGVTVSQWDAIGLLSAPRLSAGLAGGRASQFYSISGTAVGSTEKEQKENAVAEIKRLKSVISGGRLPVSTIVGSAYVVEPSLGEQFLYYSAIGLIVAIIAVMSAIVLRYRKVELVAPIIAVNVIEIFLTTSFIGIIGTLDLAAMAGIIAIIGSGVDDQIIIIDELLKKGRTQSGEELQKVRGVKERLGKAFFIIFTVAGVAVATMFPLLISGIVEVMGFAFSTIIGIVIGVLLTRPAFGVVVEEMSWK